MSPFHDVEREEIDRAWMRVEAEAERLKALAAWEAYRQGQEHTEREKRAMEWAVSTGAKP